MRTARLYFDPLSPYAYLALSQAEGFGEEHELHWHPRPVVYAALLDHHGLVGPVESEAKRRYTFADVLRCTQRLGLPLVGPPHHPFRSLEALRVAALYQDAPNAVRLAAELCYAAWGEGGDLGDWAVLERVARDAGVPASEVASLRARCGLDSTKALLRANTEDAIQRGVFGVPTFEFEGELYWGHDRLEQLSERVRGLLPPTGERVAELVQRPRGAERPAARLSSPSESSRPAGR